MRVILTTCPDCGASPAETRCECDFIGIRAQRRVDELLAYHQARCRAAEEQVSELGESCEQMSRHLAASDDIIKRCHAAIGEGAGSDDASLPDVIAQIVSERDRRIAELESERDSAVRAHAEEQQAIAAQLQTRVDQLEAALSAAREDSARLDKACEEMMIGGNHLASALIGWLGAEETKFPPYTADFETAQNVISDPRIYDAWVAWRAIMRFRDAIEVARKERT